MPIDSRSVLFVSPGPDLVNPASGEGKRLKHLSKELADVGWEVSVLVPANTTSTVGWASQTFTYNQWSLPYLTDLNPSFGVALRDIFKKHNIDVVHLSKGVCTATALVRLLSEDTVVVYASQNLEAEHAQDFVDPQLPIYKRVIGPRIVPLIERITVGCADGITTVSESDLKSFTELYDIPREKIAAIPTGTTDIDDSMISNPRQVRSDFNIDLQKPVAVFHGSYSHPPNQEAIDLIVNHLNPALQQQGCATQFLLIGEGVPKFDKSNINSLGFVDDLYSVLNAADFAVVPILHGGGTKTKIFDYISLELPMVATEKAVEGIDIINGQHGMILPDVDPEFVSAIIEMSTDKSMRQQHQLNLEKKRQDMSWSRTAERLGIFYAELAGLAPEEGVKTLGET